MIVTANQTKWFDLFNVSRWTKAASDQSADYYREGKQAAAKELGSGLCEVWKCLRRRSNTALICNLCKKIAARKHLKQEGLEVLQ